MLDRTKIKILSLDGVKLDFSPVTRFLYEYNGEQFRSIYSLFSHFKEEPGFFDDRQGSSERLHKKGWDFAYSQSVKEFFENNDCYWLMDVIHSYVRYFSDVYYDDSNQYKERTAPAPHYRLYVKFFRDVGGKPLFVIEDNDDKGVYTVAQQQIAFSDLKRNVFFYLSDGYLFFPSEA